MNHEQHQGRDDGPQYEQGAVSAIPQRDRSRGRIIVEFLVPELCDVTEVQVRSDCYDAVHFGRAKDSDDPAQIGLIMGDIDTLFDL